VPSLDVSAHDALIALDQEDVKAGGLLKFVELAWAQVEPARYMSNWHVGLICEHLEALHRLEILDLLIEVPPGCMKSLTAAVFFPAWVWINDPGHKFIFATYAQDLSDRDAKRHRDLVASEWFRDRWGDKCSIGEGQLQQVRMFETAQKGFRFSTSVGGVATGRHADTLVFDDPNRVQDAYTGSDEAGAAFDKSHTFWNVGMSTRRANPTTTRNLVIAQRLHDVDVPGRLASEGYRRLRIPMRYDPNLVSIPRGVDPRAESGETMLWPERFPESDVAKLEVKLGPIHASAQLQQNPVPDSGALFKMDGWRYWTIRPDLRGAQVVLSLDCTFKGEATSDYVVIEAWARIGSRFYLLDQVRGQWTFTETCDAFKAFAAKWPTATAKLVEDKANGTAVMNALARTVSGMIPIEPHGGKQARAHATSPLYAAGNVYIPEPGPEHPWVSDYQQEHLRFPRGANDDQVDCTSQALNYFAMHPAAAYAYDAAKRTDASHATRPVRSGYGWRGGGGAL
jgi:predicted phage terminase large subunit-like protein